MLKYLCRVKCCSYGVIFPHKMKKCNKCDEDILCDECDKLVNHKKEFSDNFNEKKTSS